MPLNFQFGFEHFLYIAHDGAGNGQALDQRPGGSGTVDFDTATWVEYGNVRTVNIGGSTNSVDITTRDEARSGFSTEVDATTTGEMTFEIRYKPTNSSGTPQDFAFEALLKAWLNRDEIAAVDLDKELNDPGAQGLVGNWTVSFSNQKEVQGVVLANLTLKLSSFPNWIRYNDVGGTFDIIS